MCREPGFADLLHRGDDSGGSALRERLKRVDPRKIVFWVGCGVDVNPPTNLPDAGSLTRTLLNQTCGEDAANNILKAYGDLHWNLPRLETVIQEIQVFEGELSDDCMGARGSILQGFKSFLEAPVNDCHRVLAQYLHRGANVVTPNYGNAIPLAHQEQYKERLQFEYSQEMEMYLYSSSNADIGKIYHIHGVADELRSMGMSLGSVKKPLPARFKETVRNWILDGCVFIFVGYSCSDTIDVTVMFEELQGAMGGNASAGIMIQYSREDRGVAEAIDGKVRAVLNSFDTSMQYNLNTMRFMQSLCLEPLSESQASVRFDWKERFNRHAARYSDGLSHCVALGYVRLLGLNPALILGKDWRKRQVDLSMFRANSWYYDYHVLANLGRDARSGGRRAHRRAYIQKMDTNLSRSNILAQRGRFKRAARLTPLSQIQRELDACIVGGRPISWDISTPVNRHAQWIIRSMALPLVGKLARRKYADDARAVIRINRSILDQGNGAVCDFVQILTALRYNGMLKMLASPSDESACADIRRAIYFYDEITCCIGSCDCRLLCALAHLLRLRFFRRGQGRAYRKVQLDEAGRHLKEAKEILDVIQTRNERWLYACVRAVH